LWRCKPRHEGGSRKKRGAKRVWATREEMLHSGEGVAVVRGVELALVAWLAIEVVVVLEAVIVTEAAATAEAVPAAPTLSSRTKRAVPMVQRLLILLTEFSVSIAAVRNRNLPHATHATLDSIHKPLSIETNLASRAAQWRKGEAGERRRELVGLVEGCRRWKKVTLRVI
jgi:hypothetical protein